MLRKMKPGQLGTKQLLEKYGAQLVCVRYRYDAATSKRIKTVESIVAETEWLLPSQRIAADEIVWLKTGFVDRARQQQHSVRQEVSGTASTTSGTRYDVAVKLGLATHVERCDVSL